MVRNVKKFILFDSGEWTVDNGQLTMESGKWREAIRETRNTKH